LATWIWASKKIEKEIVSKCLEHCLQVLSIVDSLVSLLKAIEEGQLESANSIFAELDIRPVESDVVAP